MTAGDELRRLHRPNLIGRNIDYTNARWLRGKFGNFYRKPGEGGGAQLVTSPYKDPADQWRSDTRVAHNFPHR